ncbi:MAG: 3-hydroxyacyl-CoA dehydrogenase family protein [Candidatus Eisenbacteria bacterium]|nr:3-hydroxyacyl-CoA dehydrogenase family protein [Candidatus Eisenbacteria bacterium]
MTERMHIIGAGVMGCGIAEHLARLGHAVVLIDSQREARERARARLSELTRLACFLGGERTDPDEVWARVKCTGDLGELRDASFLLENVTEDRGIKRAVYAECDSVCPADCVFISNTSAIPITELGAMTGRPERVVGVHFMNPVARISTVELIPGERTSAETLARTQALLARMGKRAVLLKDGAGFVSNRLLMSFVNEAARLAEEGIASPAEIDVICRECFGHRMGPLETADLIGLDTIARTLEVLHGHFPGDRYRACERLMSAMRAGKWGRKSGEGFYEYE